MRRIFAISAIIVLVVAAVSYAAKTVKSTKSNSSERLTAKQCPPDSVQLAATSCFDMYEASVWQTTNATTIGKIWDGSVTLADLTTAGAVQLGLVPGDLIAAGCPEKADGCVDFYAVSIPGVKPAAFINWFQAAAVARNSLKRLPTNQEWQVAALGTPDGAPCNVSSGSVANTGSAPGCISDVGVFDMVGNLYEMVAEWVPLSSGCPGWGGFSDDHMCLSGASTNGGPGALFRGGSFLNGTGGGVFAVLSTLPPVYTFNDVGFHAAR